MATSVPILESFLFYTRVSVSLRKPFELSCDFEPQPLLPMNSTGLCIELSYLTTNGWQLFPQLPFFIDNS
jgi:hypothetical protein